MSIADKLIQITENLKKIYDKGFQDGSQGSSDGEYSDGYNQGYSEGWDSGYWAGYDEGYMAGSGDMGEGDREYYNCPNCGSDFDIGIGEPQICPHCETDLGEWWDGTPEYTCRNCGTYFRTDGPPICPDCGVNQDEWYEDMPSFTCPNCGETLEFSFDDEDEE